MRWTFLLFLPRVFIRFSLVSEFNGYVMWIMILLRYLSTESPTHKWPHDWNWKNQAEKPKNIRRKDIKKNERKKWFSFIEYHEKRIIIWYVTLIANFVRVPFFSRCSIFTNGPNVAIWLKWDIYFILSILSFLFFH